MEKPSFGYWLKRRRRERGITQSQIEKLAEVSHSHLSKIENGHVVLPEKDTRDRIHRVLGTSDDDLVEVGILEKVIVKTLSGDPATIYIAPDLPYGGAMRSYDALEGVVRDRIIQKLDAVNFSAQGRLETLEGMLDLWIRSDRDAGKKQSE